MNLSDDIRCVGCSSASLDLKEHLPVQGSVYGGIICANCGLSYDIINGVPFFGGYEPEDFIGLIEVVATGMMNQSPIDIGFARHLYTLLGNYHHAEDKAEFIRSHPDDMVRAPWFSDHRYHEWMQADTLLAGKDLAGKKILNVGAGFGFDSVPLVDAGAEVTCIDYAPTIVAMGKKGLPAARWIGGFSHALPFKDESFDIVCSNAAMHHMRSTPVALREMLRVLKPSGFLYTCGDPTRPDSSSEELEFEVFNRHEGVLSGVNEGIIRFGDFYDTLHAFGDAIDLGLIATVSEASGIAGAAPIGNGAFGDCWVPCWPQNIDILREQSGGGICVAVTKRASVPIRAECQSPYTLPAGVLAAWLADPETAFTRLMAWAPDRLVNLPFPGDRQNWFSLLNGWMAPEAPFETRRGFNRARWLLRQPAARELKFAARKVAGHGYLNVLVNGKPVATMAIGNEWIQVRAPLASHARDAPFLVELRLTNESEDMGFDARCFEVRDRTLT